MGGGIRWLPTTHGRGIRRTFLGDRGEGMVPKVSPLVLAFLTTTGRSVNPSLVRECWPSKNDIVPRQPMNLLRARITHCLDKAAT